MLLQNILYLFFFFPCVCLCEICQAETKSHVIHLRCQTFLFLYKDCFRTISHACVTMMFVSFCCDMQYLPLGLPFVTAQKRL